jgi:kynurenine formamidase|tara:strand:+ start:11188 stop:12183 length:996 start_codon:yes stop_codon:yes gene_type:complete
MNKKKWSSLIVCTLALNLVATSIEADSHAIPKVSKAEFDRWLKEISNWGRWGKDDELGTLNLITPAKRIAAAKQVREGVSVSLALDLNKKRDALNGNPFEHTLSSGVWGGHETAGDRYAVEYHGFAHSHMDGLPHFAHDGKMYNGFSVDALKPTGSERLGIENFKNGVFTRGVLVDMPWFKGVDYLEPGTAITVDDLLAWEKKTGITVGSGDVLLIRTGRWEMVRQKGQWNFLEKAAGSHASVAKWLKERDVAVIGCDGVSDVMPSGVEGKVNALHELVLVGLGMPILDNLDLDALAREAGKRNRWEFLFVGAPLRVPGGTGSPLNPIATF